jgi:DNA-binding transcriptional regulator YhcF (GntR family)
MAWWGWLVPTLSGMTIDQASFEPVYRQLARILREQIQAGELRPGAALPSEATLSQTFGVGRDAVRDALGSLRSEGLIITTRGIGTFVGGSDDAEQQLGAGVVQGCEADFVDDDQVVAEQCVGSTPPPSACSTGCCTTPASWSPTATPTACAKPEPKEEPPRKKANQPEGWGLSPGHQRGPPQPDH